MKYKCKSNVKKLNHTKGILSVRSHKRGKVVLFKTKVKQKRFHVFTLTVLHPHALRRQDVCVQVVFPRVTHRDAHIQVCTYPSLQDALQWEGKRCQLLSHYVSISSQVHNHVPVLGQIFL